MKDLTHDQIQCVIDWMNEWDQLRGTAIPIRFEEDFSKRLNGLERPPIGLVPKWINNEARKAEILAAVARYQKAKKEVPKEWLHEFAELCGLKLD